MGCQHDGARVLVLTRYSVGPNSTKRGHFQKGPRTRKNRPRARKNRLRTRKNRLRTRINRPRTRKLIVGRISSLARTILPNMPGHLPLEMTAVVSRLF